MATTDGYGNTQNVFHSWGFSKQNSEIKRLLNLSQSLFTILQEKSELQMAYSRGLDKLHVRLRDTLGTSAGGTVHCTWLQLAKYLESEARAHQDSAAAVLTGLVQPWAQLCDSLLKARKPLKIQVDTAATSLTNGYTNELKTRRCLVQAYQRACDRLLLTIHRKPSCVKNGTLPTSTGPLIRGISSSSNSLGTELPEEEEAGLRRHPSDLGRISSPLTIAVLHSDQASQSLTAPNVHAVSQAEKAKRQCSIALMDYYKAFMHAEDARVEWHTVVLNCLSEQRDLERQRLQFLTNALSTYGKLTERTANVLLSSATELNEVIQLADPAADIQHFRERCRHQPTDLTDKSSTEVHQQSTREDSTAMGRSQQRLLDIPGERAVHLSEGDTLTADNGSSKRHFLGLSSPKSSGVAELQRQCLTRSNLFHCLDMLHHDVEREQRTKQGLINLIQVYSQEPIFSNPKTFAEARRQLFVSRLRLIHLTSCLQKVAYSLIHAFACHEIKDAGTSQQHVYFEGLVNAGFQHLPWYRFDKTGSLGPACRWISVPDLDDESALTPVSRSLEWPPVPLNEKAREDLNSDLFDMEVRRVRQLDARQRESLNFGLKFCSVSSLGSQRSKTPEIQSSSAALISKNSESDTTNRSASVDSNKVRLQWKVTPIFGIDQNTRSASSQRENFAHSTSYSAPPDSVIEGTDQSNGAFLGKTLEDLSGLPTIRPNRKTSVNWRRQKAVPESPSSLNYDDKLRTDGHMLECKPLATAPPTQLVQPTVPVPRPKMTESISAFWLRFCQDSRNSRSQFSAVGKIVQSVDNSKKSSKRILLSDIFALQSTDHSGKENSLPTNNSNFIHSDQQPTDNIHSLNNLAENDGESAGLSDWPSCTTLHCLGWAKVLRSYQAQQKGELTLREGEIVSIMRKDDSFWWHGELNGSKGRFHVAYVEEF